MIEVLTSIVVALIGVFGVLAMIPFSVKQTQSGLDQDAATSMARNAFANFEASGFNIKSEIDRVNSRYQLNWLDDGLVPGLLVLNLALLRIVAGCYVLTRLALLNHLGLLRVFRFTMAVCLPT